MYFSVFLEQSQNSEEMVTKQCAKAGPGAEGDFCIRPGLFFREQQTFLSQSPRKLQRGIFQVLEGQVEDG